MVAPKNATGITKEKNDEKKPISASPEPFQEPEGMMTIDLNQSDDYSKENQTENAKLKQRAQIKYVSQLMCALGAILFVILVFIAIAFLNKEYHLFTVIPLKINQSDPIPMHQPTKSPTEEFVDLTKILNQALFRNKLRSGNYLENSDAEMNQCRLEQTVDACCEVFKNTDLHSLVEYCTVNDMLNILLEFELSRRKKRQIYDGSYPVNTGQHIEYLSPYPQYRADEHQNEFLQEFRDPDPNQEMPIQNGMDEFVGESGPLQQNLHNFEKPELPNTDIIPGEAEISQQHLFDTNMHHPEEQIPVSSNTLPLEQQESNFLSTANESPRVQSFFHSELSETVRENILHHVTFAPPEQKEYRYEDFHQKENLPGSQHPSTVEVLPGVKDIDFQEGSKPIKDMNSVYDLEGRANSNLHISPNNKNHFRRNCVDGEINQGLEPPLCDPENQHIPKAEHTDFGTGLDQNNMEIKETTLVSNIQPDIKYEGRKENIGKSFNIDIANILRSLAPTPTDNKAKVETFETRLPATQHIQNIGQDSNSDISNSNIGNQFLSILQNSVNSEGESRINISPNMPATNNKNDLEITTMTPASPSNLTSIKSTVEAENLSSKTITFQPDHQVVATTPFLNRLSSQTDDNFPVENLEHFSNSPSETSTHLGESKDTLRPLAKTDVLPSEDQEQENLTMEEVFSSVKFGANSNGNFDKTSESSIKSENLKVTEKLSPTKIPTDSKYVSQVKTDVENANSKPLKSSTFNKFSTNEFERSQPEQDDFSSKAKELDPFRATEDVQSTQHSYVNPCFNPYMNPYVPFIPPPSKVGSTQGNEYLKVVSVSQPRVQNPVYVLNPAMYYGIPPSPQPTYPSYPSNPYFTPSYYPPVVQAPASIVGGSHSSPVQVAGTGGQYYMCNPIPTPSSNNIAGLAGVEIRRGASNLQNLMDEMESSTRNNKSREATLICPLGEQACLDSSKCIKTHHICDSEVHCDDSSDEIACSCKERVGKLRMCDGYCDCPQCEDEQECFGCEENEFSCDDWSRFRRSTCVPLVQRCDGIKQCEITGKDEMDCSILADHIGHFPLNKISNSVGFLHRNYKGKWYPTCFGTELWAAEVCQVEAGPSAIIPKTHMTLATYPYNGLFINILPNNEVSLVSTCVQDRAAFVECPPIYCGLRFLVNNPYRAQEVDTSIEDMLDDLERAYKMRKHGLERSDLVFDADQERMEKESLNDDDHGNITTGLDNTEVDNRETKGNLTHEHLEEVIENLERTFRRRDVSDDGNATLKQTRVVGGKPSQPAAWPWLVSIYKNGIFHCGGVLINELWVVTASHCVDRFWQYYYEIQAGALRRFSFAPMDQRRWAKVIVPHEFYSKSNLRNDIALLKLSSPVRYNRYVRPICLPSETTAGKDFLNGPGPGSICTTVGWGATVEHGADPDHMREVEVPIMKHCKHKEDSDINEICAGLSDGGKDACQGDSGGPLMCRNVNNPNQWYLAGIVSHGEGCARPNEPGVYTKVSKYIGWIAENTREDKITIATPLQKCPGYICKGTKRCISKKRRCDRIIDCLLGDDEIDCENKFRELFKHSRKSVIPFTNTLQTPENSLSFIGENFGTQFEELDLVGSKMNSTQDVGNKGVPADEVVESTSEDLNPKTTKIASDLKQKYFRCKIMLQMVPLEKRCNKKIDCEDGSDEVGCSCAEYVRTIDPSAICDGITDCPDLSDENECVKCNMTEYPCRLSQKCIDLSKRCDGFADCPQNEDEMNCATLTNGRGLTIDKDNRPMFKSRGIVTINHQGEWRPLCLNTSSLLANQEPSIATVICSSLGFDEYMIYHKYKLEDKVISPNYLMISGRMVMDPEPKDCYNCCDGLYISCSNTSISSTLHHKSLEQVKELYFSPWIAALYFNGEYKCMGTLLDKFWIVASSRCFKGVDLLEANYVVAVLGKGKLHLHIKGPHEQIIRVNSIVNVNDTDIVLLRLEKDVKFTRYIQAAHLNARREGIHKEKCYAVGQDNENKAKFVSLTPLKNCLVGFRCFEKKIEEDCQDKHPWSGTIVCDSRVGWYPAAVFYEEDGHCGFSHKKKYTSVRFYKNQIFKLMTVTPKSTPPPLCPGFNCSLGNCVPEEKICNGIDDCSDGEDEKGSVCYEKEKQCHLKDACVCPLTDLKCPSTNQCYPKSSFCDRTNNCGEYEDEPDICMCRNYLKLTSPEKICDGTLNCMDRSDEDPEICSCKLEDFQCGKLNKCIPQEMVCDGVKDCPNGEDEATCLALLNENLERSNAGEVMTRTAGVWHGGCFDLNYDTIQLEEICTNLGINATIVSQLSPPPNTTTFSLRPVLDSFDVVWLRRQPGNKMRLRLRSGHDPYLKFEADKKCHRLFAACI